MHSDSSPCKFITDLVFYPNIFIEPAELYVAIFPLMIAGWEHGRIMFAAAPNISFRPGKIYSHVFNYRISILRADDGPLVGCTEPHKSERRCLTMSKILHYRTGNQNKNGIRQIHDDARVTTMDWRHRSGRGNPVLGEAFLCQSCRARFSCSALIRW